MKILDDDVITIAVEKNKKETVVTAKVGRMVWGTLAALIAMILIVKR